MTDNFSEFLNHYKQKNNIDYFDFVSIMNATRVHYEQNNYHYEPIWYTMLQIPDNIWANYEQTWFPQNHINSGSGFSNMYPTQPTIPFINNNIWQNQPQNMDFVTNYTSSPPFTPNVFGHRPPTLDSSASVHSQSSVCCANRQPECLFGAESTSSPFTPASESNMFGTSQLSSVCAENRQQNASEQSPAFKLNPFDPNVVETSSNSFASVNSLPPLGANQRDDNELKDILEYAKNNPNDFTTMTFYIDKTYELKIVKKTAIPTYFNDTPNYGKKTKNTLQISINWVSTLCPTSYDPEYIIVPIDNTQADPNRKYKHQKTILTIKELINLVKSNEIDPDTRYGTYCSSHERQLEIVKLDAKPFEISNVFGLCPPTLDPSASEQSSPESGSNPHRLSITLLLNIKWEVLLFDEPILIKNLKDLIELAKKNPQTALEQYYFVDEKNKIDIENESFNQKIENELTKKEILNFMFFLNNLSTSIEMLQQNNIIRQNEYIGVKFSIFSLNEMIKLAKKPIIDIKQYGFMFESSKQKILAEFSDSKTLLDTLNYNERNIIRYLITNLQTYKNLVANDLEPSMEIPTPEKTKTVSIDSSIDSIRDLINLLDKNPYDPTTEYNIDLKGLHQIRQELVELDAMVGVCSLKNSILNQLIYFIQEPLLENSVGGYKHTILCGPPGTGKTEIAKIIGNMYSKLGILKKSVFKKVTRNDLVAGYLGQTAMKTKEVIEKCLGGCLFIDEAYSLGHSSQNDCFSKECIDILCEALSDHKDDLMVIIAGYENELDECFFSLNSGLKSRFSWKFKIDEYTAKELCEIFEKKVAESKWVLDNDANWSPKWVETNIRNFKNYGRDIEQLLYYVKICHSRRIYGKSKELAKIITKDDIEKGFKFFLENRDKKDELQNIHYGLYV